jgi:hypothetical protein
MTILKKGKLYIIFTIAIVIIAAVAVTVTALASGPDTDQTALPSPTATPSNDQAYPPPPDYSPDPVPVPTPTYPGPGIPPGTTYSPPLYGPSTRGAAIQIASKTVQLPDDAEVGGLIQFVLNTSSQTLFENLPALTIIRGDSELLIGQNTGVVINGRIEPGEEGAFDFLKEYFPDQSTTIDSIPALPKPTIPSVDWGFDMPEVSE